MAELKDSAKGTAGQKYSISQDWPCAQVSTDPPGQFDLHAFDLSGQASKENKRRFNFIHDDAGSELLISVPCRATRNSPSVLASGNQGFGGFSVSDEHGHDRGLTPPISEMKHAMLAVPASNNFEWGKRAARMLVALGSKRPCRRWCRGGG